jgi:hypothetical protein
MTEVRCTGCPASVDGHCSKEIVELIGFNAHCVVLEEILIHKHEAMLERVRRAEKKGQTIISVHEIQDPDADKDQED